MLFILGRQYSKNSVSYCCWLAGMLKLHLPDNWLNSNEEDIDQTRWSSYDENKMVKYSWGNQYNIP